MSDINITRGGLTPYIFRPAPIIQHLNMLVGQQAT